MEVVRDANTCVGAAADMLIDSLLLGYADALVLPVPSTFTILPKVMAHSRGAPSCMFIGDVAGPEHQEAGPRADVRPPRPRWSGVGLPADGAAAR